MLKTTLRQHLEQIYQKKELSCWFDPLDLRLDQQNKAVRVFFPHALFAQWFMTSVRQNFEDRVTPFLEGFSLVYDCPQSHISTASGDGNGNPPENKTGAGERENRSSPENGVFSAYKPPERYTFDSFLVNKKNDFPLAAAREALKRITRPKYNPLVVYGQSGSGKTHLLGAMANALIEESGDVSVYYGDLELIGLINTESSFSRRVFFIDNAQRVCTSPQLQEQLVDFLDRLSADNTPMTFAFDQHPGQCENILKKLVSRLSSGLVLELKKPDIDIRRQYIQKKNDALDLELSKEQELTLAQRYTDFRAIDGILARISAYRSSMKNEGDFRSLLDKDEEQKFLTPGAVIAISAKYFSVTPEEIMGKSRNRAIILPRQTAIYLIRELLGMPLVQIGKIFGGRDHSSIVYAIKKISESENSNKVTNKIVTELKQLCLSGRT